ncbi:hypothetical protein SSX86_031384 [Deinandra increscens subsp. villosa]|uniref:Nudix hydrolase domain-containing protein n=1 Tax=Deinandra increscens subsp. villosa TaxID=3103831 RepID=A0AAP0GIA0_9ASTR
MPIFFPRSNKFTQFLLAFPNRHRLVATVVLSSSSMEAPPNGYRRNVDIYLINSSKKIFSASRLDIPEAWQMPQGGVDEGEDPRAAAVREFREETGVTCGKILMEVCIDIIPERRAAKDQPESLNLYFTSQFRVDSFRGLINTCEAAFTEYKKGKTWRNDNETYSTDDPFIYIWMRLLGSVFSMLVISISTVKTDDEITGKCIQKPKIEVLMTLNEQYDKPKADVIILKSKCGRGQPKDKIVDGKTDVKNAADTKTELEISAATAEEDADKQ